MKFFLILVLSSVFVLPLNADECSNYNQNIKKATYTIGGDWLYWKTSDTQLNYGATVSVTTTPTTADIVSMIQRPDFKYDNGYRVYGIYQPCNYNWECAVIYSHIPSYSTNSNGNPNMPATLQNFIQIFGSNFPLLTILSDAPLTSLDVIWDTSVSYLDIDFSRECKLACNFNISPHFGLRGYYEKQTFSLNGTADPELSFNSVLGSKISSFGLEGGVKASWNIYKGFSFIGNVGGAVLYARTHNSGSLVASSFIDDLVTTIGYKDKVHHGLTIVDAFIGVEYAGEVKCRSFSIHAGWEIHNIYEASEFSLTGLGCLTLQGLTLGGDVSF